MNTLNFNPLFNELKPMASAFDELLNDGISSVLGASLATSSPRVNIIDANDNYKIELAAPGRNKEDFELALEKNNVTVTLVAESDKESNKENYIRKEFVNSSFKKSFYIPEDVDTAKIDASYAEGVLTITLPKLGEDDNTWSRSIEIK